MIVSVPFDLIIVVSALGIFKMYIDRIDSVSL